MKTNESRNSIPDNKDMRVQVTGSVKDACLRYGLGIVNMKKLAAEAHAVVRVGKCYLINFNIVDEYMRKISQ